MALTVVQVSDAHLSGLHGQFVPNWRRLLAHLHADRPDLVVSTGDVSFDGARLHRDLAFAVDRHRHLPAPWRAVPGNHDVGEEPGAESLGQPAGPERWARWRSTFGSAYWVVDAGGWRLVGLDCSLLGTGLPAEATQWAWLQAVLGGAAGPVGLFLHKPIVLEGPDEEPDPAHTVHPGRRADLLAALAGSPVRFVASGHLHQHRVADLGGVTHAWCPSTAFVTSRPRPGASPVLGWLRWTLDGDRASVTLVSPPELAPAAPPDLDGPAAPPDPADLAAV